MARRRRSRSTRVRRSTPRSPTSLRLEVTQASSRAPGRRRQRGLLGHSGQAQHPLSRVLFREGGAGLHRSDHRRDRKRRRQDDVRHRTGVRSDAGVEAVRRDADDRQRRADRKGTLRPDRSIVRERSGSAWSRCFRRPIENQAERLPARPAADAHRHAAEVPAVPGRQLSRRRSDRGPLRVEEDARPVVGAPRPHGAVGLSLDRRPRPATSSCCGPRT